MDESYTEEEIWALRGLNPNYVAQNSTAREIALNYQDDVFRATNPMYSSIIDPYYAAGTSTEYPWTKGPTADLPTMPNYMSPDSMKAYLAYLTEVERLNKATKK